MIADAYLKSPFSAHGFVHRKKDCSVAAVRKLRKNVYVLTNIPEFSDAVLLEQVDGLVRDLTQFSDEQIADSAFYTFFFNDEDSLEPISRIIRCGGLFIPPLHFAKTSYVRTSRHAERSIHESRGAIGKLFGGEELHENLCQAVDMTRDLDGDLLEIGVFTGSSASTLLRHTRNLGVRRRCWLMDTFTGFTYQEAAKSADGIWSRTHQMAGEAHIHELAGKLGPARQEIHFVIGNICTAKLPSEIQKLALVNIDVDIYEAVLASLRKVAPLVQKRGIIICEDATSTPGLYGAYIAMEEFLKSELGKTFIKVFLRSQYFLIRVDD